MSKIKSLHGSEILEENKKATALLRNFVYLTIFSLASDIKHNIIWILYL